MMMTNNMLPELYDCCKATLKVTSKDPKNSDYISNSMLEVYNFDAVRDVYYDAHQLRPVEEEVNSCDAFYADQQNNTGYLIEFKNSPLSTSNIDHTEIKEKILGSLLILTDISQMGISETRKATSFILVYSSAKDRRKYERKSHAIGIPKKFNFKKYEGIYYKQCLIFGNAEFQRRFVDKWESGDVM